MKILERFVNMLSTKVKPKGTATLTADDESLTPTERARIEHLRRETMREDLLRDGYGGHNRGVDGKGYGD